MRLFTWFVLLSFSVLALELENIIPEVVVTGIDGYKAVAYDKITVVLT